MENFDSFFHLAFLADNDIRVSRDGATAPGFVSPDPHVILQAMLMPRIPVSLPQVMRDHDSRIPEDLVNTSQQSFKRGVVLGLRVHAKHGIDDVEVSSHILYKQTPLRFCLTEFVRVSFLRPHWEPREFQTVSEGPSHLDDL